MWPEGEFSKITSLESAEKGERFLAAAMGEPESPHILSIDDDLLIQKIIEKILTSQGYRLTCASNARQAMERIQARSPSLILLDVMMPEVDGYEFCASLQKNPKTSLIPVIFLTALNAGHSKAKALAAGGVDYLVKPVDRELLLGKIREHLQMNARWQDLPRQAREKEEKTAPAQFNEFKESLLRRGQLPPGREKELTSLPPSEIYTLSSALGLAPDHLARQMAEFLSLPYLPRIQPDEILLGALPSGFCRNFCVLPLKGKKTKMAFALGNPFDWELTESLRKFTGSPLSPEILVTPREKIQIFFQGNGQAKDNDLSTPILPDRDKKPLNVSAPSPLRPEEDQENYPIISLTNTLLQSAVNERASDIHIEPKENETIVRLRIDGDMNDFWNLEKSTGRKLVSRLKALAEMDIAEKRKPQDGSVEAVILERTFKLRLATTSTPNGESLTIRILDPTRKPKTLQELGMSPENVKRMTQFTGRTSGLILLVGPTGSGKTTTVYSLLSQIDCQTRSLISVEDPVEYRIPFAKQQQVNQKAGVTFEVLLRSLVRQDPDILFIGEVRDPYSAKIAMDFASTGHLTLTTLHTSNATTAIFRLERLEISRGIMADAILAVVAQRILKKLCPVCKKIQPITREEAALLAPFTPEIPSHLARPVGCPKCKQTGFMGREGIYEVLHCDPQVNEMIRAGRPISEIRHFVRQRGVRLISDEAVEKVKNLTFSLKEVYEKVLLEENLSPSPAGAGEEDRGKPGGENMPAPLRLLVVEDDPTTQKVITHFLQKEGYQVLVAEDGVDALIKLGQSRFDLILSDINIPNLDGFRLLEMVQQKGLGVPVILMTARVDPRDEVRGLELGATDYLRKPIQKELLLMRLRRILPNKGAPGCGPQISQER